MGKSLRTRALLLSLMLATIGLTSAVHAQCQWADDFDSYTTGTELGFQGGWFPWDNDPAVNAELVTGQAQSSPNWAQFEADDDVIRELPAINSGVWRVQAQVRIAPGQTGRAWWIILNTYNAGGPYNWSCQMGFELNALTDEVEVFDEGGSAIAGNPAIANLGAVAGEWLLITTDIDFDNNLYHNYVTTGGLGQVDISGVDRTWAAGAGSNVALGALDLYSTATPFCGFDSVAVVQIDAIGGTVLSGGQCSPFDLVTASQDCSSGDIELDWSFLCAPPTTIDITRTDAGGTSVLVADDIDATTTPFTDLAVPAGDYTYTFTSDCGETFDYAVQQTSYAGATDIIFNKDGGGRHDDGQVIFDTLSSLGLSPSFGSLTDPCLPDPAITPYRIWVTLGSFPEDGQLTAVEGTNLTNLHLAGAPVYLAGGDHWGFHPDTDWRGYDGVDQTLVEDGDDSADTLRGVDSLVGFDLSNHDAFYFQDQDGFEWTDRISPVTAGLVTPDLGGDDAGVIWETDDNNPVLTYSIGVFYASSVAPVISVSWEFAGFTGDQEALMAQYVEALGGPAPACTAPGPLAYSSDCTSGDFSLTWSGSADSYDVLKDGLVVGTYPAGTTEHTEAALESGIYTYEVIATCGADTASALTEVVHAGPAGVATHVVIRADRQQGALDDSAAIFAALIANGESAMVLPSLEDPCFPTSSGATIWIALGTWPSNHVLTDPEADILVQEHTVNNSKVYIGGPDHWGNDPATIWASYDGCDVATDGDDTFTTMQGSASSFGLDLTAFSAAYNQDQDGNDFTDQMTVAGPGLDLGGDDIAVIWEEGTGLYITGVHYASVFGDVLSVAWEFAGYDGDQTALMAEYLNVMGDAPPGDPFRRGDSNDDGTVNIADAVYSANALFVPGSPPPACVDAGDTNGDGLFNIADVIYTANFLFIMGSPPPPAPFPDCGIDPTPIGCPGFVGSGC